MLWVGRPASRCPWPVCCLPCLREACLVLSEPSLGFAQECWLQDVFSYLSLSFGPA
jgi:hypothetical protein